MKKRTSSGKEQLETGRSEGLNIQAQAQELISGLPENYYRYQADNWIEVVLAFTPTEAVTREYELHENRRYTMIILPELEAKVYHLLVKKFGEPGSLPVQDDEIFGRPNITRLFLWAIALKYNMSIRLGVIVTPDGILKQSKIQ